MGITPLSGLLVALGQRLSKTGSVLRRGSRGGRASGAGTKGLLLLTAGSAGGAGGGSCLPGQAAQHRERAAFPLGGEVAFPRKSRLFFHLAPQPGPGSLVCSSVAAMGHPADAAPRG